MSGFAALRHRDFTLFLIAKFCTSVGSQMLVVAVGWQVYAMTGRLLDLGLIGLSQFLPFIALALVAGHTADRHDRRRVLVLCNLALLACSAALLWLTLGGVHRVWPIFTALGGLGIARAFHAPAAQAIMPNLVPTSAFSNAVALNSSTWQIATVAGPSIGGVLYSLAGGSGAALVYAVVVVLLLGAVVLMSLIRAHQPARSDAEFSLSQMLEGFRFVWRRKPVLGAISLDLFAVLFGGATALLPAFTSDVLHAGPDVFGLLRAAPGVGAGITALLLAFCPITRRVGVWMFGGVVVFGIATIVYALSREVWLVLAALAILGAGDMVSVFIRHILVQMETPDHIRGRVSAVNSVFIGASNELGEFESGLTAAWLGLIPALVIGGVLTLGVAFLWARVWFPMLWRMDSFDEPAG
ncbi:MAG: MFS transporter [Steroidobacteraceae bacterium]